MSGQDDVCTAPPVPLVNETNLAWVNRFSGLHLGASRGTKTYGCRQPTDQTGKGICVGGVRA